MSLEIVIVDPTTFNTASFPPFKCDSLHSRWSVTSLQGPGERNFNAVSHKPKLTWTDWIELNWCACWLMGYGIKVSYPRPPQWRHRSPGYFTSHVEWKWISVSVSGLHTSYSKSLYAHLFCSAAQESVVFKIISSLATTSPCAAT